eukprot:2952051-Rhodomonas_salina.1
MRTSPASSVSYREKRCRVTHRLQRKDRARARQRRDGPASHSAGQGGAVAELASFLVDFVEEVGCVLYPDPVVIG